MTIAIPILQERISPVLDTAARLLLVTRQHGKEVRRREFVLNSQPTAALARCVAELHVDVLLCAALSKSLLQALRQWGVRVRPHLCGEAEVVLRAFYNGQLRRSKFRMPGCWGWHSDSGYCHSRTVGAMKSVRKKTGKNNYGVHTS